LIPDERIVQLIEFESKDPAFAGPMTIKWTLADVPPGGIEVAKLCALPSPQTGATVAIVVALALFVD
jgi:hypothetical protein